MEWDAEPIDPERAADGLVEAARRAWDRDRRDLTEQPPQPALLVELDVERAAEVGWLACEVRDDGTVVVASCVRPDASLVEELVREFPGAPLDFVACSREDIDTVALGVRRSRLGLRHAPTVAVRARPVHGALALGGALLALVAWVLLPTTLLSWVLLAASVVFLVGGLSQWAIEYAEALGATRRRSNAVAPHDDGREDDDARLPLYTVVLRVAGGAPGLAELFDNFRDLDYPRERTDAILVVAEGDRDTLAALRSTGSRDWARVVKVPDLDFLDVIRACDHALALARGRYIVAFDQDERPAPDQLRRAVAAFEADLVDRLEGRLAAEPLVGLRVSRLTGPRWPTPFERLAAVDEVMPVDDAWSDQPGPLRSPDVTSVHFSTGLLRRNGGFGLLYGRQSGASALARPPRVEALASRSARAVDPTARRWMFGRADRFARILLAAVRGASESRPQGDGDPPNAVTQTLVQVGGVAMFLAYPVVLGSGLVMALRHRAVSDRVEAAGAWAALGMAGTVLGVSVVVGVVRLVRRRGWRAGLGALALPAHWLLHGCAAWMAVWALVVPLSGRGVSDPADRTPGRPS